MNVVIRPPFADERAHILKSWIEDYRYVAGQRNRRWRDYEADKTREFGAILDADATRLLVQALEDDTGASDPMDVILGWICWAPLGGVDLVHWVRTRFRIGPAPSGDRHPAAPNGELLRRRKTMTALVDAARLKPHVGYTHPGPIPRRNEPGPRVASDTWLVRWLAGRGITAVPAPGSPAEAAVRSRR